MQLVYAFLVEISYKGEVRFGVLLSLNSTVEATFTITSEIKKSSLSEEVICLKMLLRKKWQAVVQAFHSHFWNVNCGNTGKEKSKLGFEDETFSSLFSPVSFLYCCFVRCPAPAFSVLMSCHFCVCELVVAKNLSFASIVSYYGILVDSWCAHLLNMV